MWDPSSKRIFISKDVTFLEEPQKPKDTMDEEYDETDIEQGAQLEEAPPEETNSESVEDISRRSTRVRKAPERYTYHCMYLAQEEKNNLEENLPPVEGSKNFETLGASGFLEGNSTAMAT